MLRSSPIDYLNETDSIKLIHLMRGGKSKLNAICKEFCTLKQVPWQQYYLITNDSKKKYYSVRDYLILSKIKSKIAYNFDYKIVFSLVTQLTAAKHLLTPNDKNMLTMDYSNKCRKINTSHLGKQLKITAPVNVEKETQEIYQAIAQKSALVVSFSTDKIKIGHPKEAELKNVFELIGTNTETKKDNQYRYNRIACEIVLFSYLPVRDLQFFTLHPQLHPTYATLQFYNCIKPITNYGSSFLILSPDYLHSSTYFIGGVIDMISQSKFSLPGLLEFPHSVYQQFPDDLKKACQTMATTGLFPTEFDFQYYPYKSKYIEAQLHAPVQIHDASHVQHIHLTFDHHLPSLKQIEQWMCNGITVSIGKNPFESKEYSSGYQSGETQRVLCDKQIENAYRACLILAETTPENLSYKLSHFKNTLFFKFVMPLGSLALRKHKAMHLLYLMGSRKVFNEPYPYLPANSFDYPLTLTGQAIQNGHFMDHDAYTYDLGSMTKLLNVFLKRLIASYLVSIQNEEYFKTHQTPHPITGKGASAESNLTKELYLGDGENQYDISVMSFHNYQILEIHTDHLGIRFQVWNRLLRLLSPFPDCRPTEQTKFIFFPHSIESFLERLERLRSNYFSTIFIDQKATGKVLLAQNRRFGFGTPNKPNNNPYSSADILSDSEFGTLKKDTHPEKIGESKNFPKTSYWLLNSDSLVENKAQSNYFKPDTLMKFDFFRLDNLSAEQIKQVASSFSLTEEEYKKHFGCALALASEDSLFMYLQHMQNSIQKALQEDKRNCSVSICQTVKRIDALSRHFLLPDENFGEITLHFSKETDLSCYYINLNCSSRINGNSLTIIDMNPYQLLNFIQTKKKLSFLEFLKNPRNSILALPVFIIDIELMQCLAEIPLPTVKMIVETFKKASNINVNFNFKLNPNALHENGRTLLHEAADKNRLDLVEYFINEHKADINVLDKQWNTPLTYAVQNGQQDMIKLLFGSRVKELKIPLALEIESVDGTIRNTKNTSLRSITDMIEQAALILAETNLEHLSYKINRERLRVDFRVTPNSPALHQAQAAHLLYLMGVRKAFSSRSPIQFRPSDNVFYYELPFSGNTVQSGSYTDHDAYTFNFNSITKLLDVFLKRLMVSYLISIQNADYFDKHKNPHPVTGKGATEESNLAKELKLGDDDNEYDISITCVYDYILLQIHSNDLRIRYSVYNKILKLFPNCQKGSDGQYILFPTGIENFLETFAKHRVNYFATVLVDQKETGRVMLALRKNPWEKFPLGFSTPGGHNNNPFSNIDVMQDNEFGTLKKDCKPEPIGESKEFPKTSYWLLDSNSLTETKSDPSEFLPKSLTYFDLFELGRLSPEKIKLAASSFQMTEEEYKKHFGLALALRPVDSIFRYLKHMQNTIQTALLKNNKECVVSINQSATTIKFADTVFWVPSKDFGKITIRSANKSELAGYFFKLLSYKNSLDYLKVKDAFILHNINPTELLQIIQTRKNDYFLELAKNPNILIKHRSYFDMDSELLTWLPEIPAPARSVILDKLVERFSLLYHAALNGYAKAIPFFLPNLEPFIRHLNTGSDSDPLSAAVTQGHLNVVKFLIEHKADPTNLEINPLHSAAALGYKDLMNYFLSEQNIDINQEDKQSNTPLAIAAGKGKTSSVLWLLERKASSDLKNTNNETPLLVAIRERQIDCIIALYDHKTVVKSLDKTFFNNMKPAAASRLLRCILSHEPDDTMNTLLGSFSQKFSHLPLSLYFDDMVEDIIAVAQLWKKFREFTGKSSCEIIAIEQACGVLHKFRTLNRNGFFSFRYNSCGNAAMSFLQSDYLTTPVRTIAKVMFPEYPDVGSKPCTRRIFWEDLLTEIESNKTPAKRDKSNWKAL